MPKNKKDKEPIIADVIEVVGEFSNKVDKRFDKMDKRFDKIDVRTTKIETTMVTKDYLDEKFSDLRGDLVVIIGKEDKKLRALVDILRQHKILSKNEMQKIFSMEPFPQMFIE